MDWVGRTKYLSATTLIRVQLPDVKTVTIQLLGKDDSSFDDSEVITGRWQAYIDSYVSVSLCLSVVDPYLL